ncbi:hypothetical protein V8F20_009369 [Naviculisporaceae sp. PSN 640]
MSDGRCSSDPLWATTPEAYRAADTDNQLASWWATQPRDSNDGFARQLGQSFGDQRTFFQCGIDREPSCTISGCDTFLQANDPPWAYQALVSTMNLNMYFNAIFDGVVAGQLGYTNTIPDIAEMFFPANDQNFPFGDGSPWIIAILTILFAFPLFWGHKAAMAGATTGALLIGGTTTAEDKLEPPPGSNIGSVVEMQNYAMNYGESTRRMLSEWANSTFMGEKDKSNHTILEYLAGGAFVDSDAIPPPEDIEAFYKTQMVSRTINAKWRTSKIFIMFKSTLDADINSGPSQTKYYSEEDKGVYYLYEMLEGNRMTSTLVKPLGLDDFDGSYFGITAQDITRASAKSFRAGQFNYTNEDFVTELDDVLANDGANASISDPFKEGAAWPGTWTIPVCDTGKYDWNVQYDDYSSRYGKLPCCCGPDCKDTAAFVRAANILGSQAFLRGCWEQLRTLPDLDFERIDYGYSWDRTFPVFWSEANDGVRAGVVIGIIAGGVIVLSLIICCLAACCG